MSVDLLEIIHGFAEENLEGVLEVELAFAPLTRFYWMNCIIGIFYGDLRKFSETQKPSNDYNLITELIIESPGCSSSAKLRIISINYLLGTTDD